MKKVYVVISSHGSYSDNYKKVEFCCSSLSLAEEMKTELESKYRERIPFPFNWCTEEEFFALEFVKDEYQDVYNDWWLREDQRQDFNSCYIEEIEYFE